MRLIKFMAIFIILEVFLFVMPKEMMYSNFRTTSLIIGIALIFIVIPICITIVLKELSKSENMIILAFATIMVNGPMFGFYHEHRENQDLSLNGKLIIGEVIKKKFSNGKSGDSWRIKSEYKVDYQTYRTTFEIVEKEEYQIGDSIRIIYLENYPRVYRLEGN